MKHTHELMLFKANPDKSLNIVATTLRFDPFDWMTFKAIRTLKDLGCFGLISKGAFVLVPTSEIVLAEGGELYVDENTVCFEVWTKSDGRWIPNPIFGSNDQGFNPNQLDLKS